MIVLAAMTIAVARRVVGATMIGHHRLSFPAARPAAPVTWVRSHRADVLAR
jgi:hypothetical protein